MHENQYCVYILTNAYNLISLHEDIPASGNSRESCRSACCRRGKNCEMRLNCVSVSIISVFV